MGFMNRLGNAGNRFQTPTDRVLCLCSAGLLRSPTAANVLHQEFGFNTRAAGVSDEYALIPVDEVLIRWADEIVCVEHEVFAKLMDKYAGDPMLQGHIKDKVTVLNVPDQYEWNDQQLREIIRVQYHEIGKSGREDVTAD